MIGFTVVCLSSGNGDVWSRFAFTGFAVSLAMAAVFIVTLELAFRAYGPGTLIQLILWGELTLFAGVLILLLNHWIAPIVESSPRMMETLGSLGGTYKTGDVLPATLLAASVVLLGIVVVRLGRTGGDAT
jgi:hypothetical protein